MILIFSFTSSLPLPSSPILVPCPSPRSFPSLPQPFFSFPSPPLLSFLPFPPPLLFPSSTPCLPLLHSFLSPHPFPSTPHPHRRGSRQETSRLTTRDRWLSWIASGTNPTNWQSSWSQPYSLISGTLTSTLPFCVWCSRCLLCFSKVFDPIGSFLQI